MPSRPPPPPESQPLSGNLRDARASPRETPAGKPAASTTARGKSALELETLIAESKTPASRSASETSSASESTESTTARSPTPSSRRTASAWSASENSAARPSSSSRPGPAAEARTPSGESRPSSRTSPEVTDVYTPDAAHEKENVTWLTKRWQAQQIEIERMTKQNAALQDAPRAARELMRTPEIAVLRARPLR